MNFFYEGLALHDLGECSISQSREYEGGDAVQRCKVTLRLQVDVFEATYADNFTLMRNVLAGLSKQNGIFRWEDTDTGSVYLNQSVTLASHDLPEEPNAWGTYHQRANLVFYYYEQNLDAQNIPLTITSSGTLFNLYNVTKWSETTTLERYSPLRDPRRMATGKLSVSGMILADPTQSLSARRQALLTRKQELDSLNGATAAIKYGPIPGAPRAIFQQAVRIDEFTVEMDAAVYAIHWSFTGHFTKYPEESDYALAEWQVEERDQNTGEQFLVLSGKVAATDEATARAKVDEIAALVLVNFGYEESQQLRNDTTPSTADSNNGQGDGQAFIELAFTQEYRRWRLDNQGAGFKKTGASGNPINLGNVRSWVQSYEARRFNELRSQRQDAGGRVEASGTWLGDPSADLGVRRAALIALAQSMVAAVNGADGTLTYGTAFNKVVRASRFVAEVNQTITGIDWTLVAQWSEFPNEGGYATVEFTVTQRSSVEDGEEFMTLAGRINAPDETLARAKLTSVRSATLTTYGYTLAQQLRQESAANGIYANGDQTAGSTHEQSDGTTFTELTFSEEYRRRKTNLVSWSLRTSTRTERASGLVLTTFSGHVIASGDTVDAAYAAAAAKASTLGENKESSIGPTAFLKSSSLSWDKRQTQASNVEEFVRLEFSYEYQSKEQLKFYLEANAEVTVDTFGIDSEAVSGFVVGPDELTMRTAYAGLVRNGYTGRLVRGERTALSRLQTGLASSFTVGGAIELLRLDFNLQVHRVKDMGTVAYRYGINTSRDFLKLEIRTRLHGSITAASASAAAIALKGLLTAISSGQQVRSEESEERAYAINAGDASGQNVFERLDFDEEYVDRLTGVSGLLEMELTEEVQYSGVRWALQPTVKNDDGSGGFTVPQDVSVTEGSRMVRGSVTAATLATAETWAKKQRALLTGDANGGHFVLPEKWERGYEFVPRIEGVAPAPGGGTDNVRLFKVGFTFSEVLPSYPAPI